MRMGGSRAGEQDFHFVDSAKEVFFPFMIEAKNALMKINIVLIMIDIYSWG